MPTMQKTESWFRSDLTLGQAITIGFTIVGTVCGAWYNLSTRVTVVEQQIEMLKEYKADNKEFQRTVLLKLEDIQGKVNNKEDRK